MLNNILVRLGIYYAATMAFLGGLLKLFPQILDYVAKERARSVVGHGESLNLDAGVAIPSGEGFETLIVVFMALYCRSF